MVYVQLVDYSVFYRGDGIVPDASRIPRFRQVYNGEPISYSVSIGRTYHYKDFVVLLYNSEMYYYKDF